MTQEDKKTSQELFSDYITKLIKLKYEIETAAGIAQIIGIEIKNKHLCWADNRLQTLAQAVDSVIAELEDEFPPETH